MSDPLEPTLDEVLAVGGGNATAGGVSFQAEVGSVFAVQLLAERRLNGRLGLGDTRPRSLRFETEAPVDDILIETDPAGWIFVQAKSSFTLSGSSDSELGRVADQIVRQWHACAQGAGQRGWDRPLVPRTDRILIAVGRRTSATITEHLASALGALQANSAAPLPKHQQKALDTFTVRLREAWRALIGAPPDNSVTQSILNYVRVCKFDFDGADRQLAIEWLRPLLGHEHSAEAGFDVLARECQRLMETRLGTDASSLRRHLAQSGLAPKAAPSFQNDVEILRTYSDETQTQLSHYEETKVGDDEIRINRQCTQAVILAAIKGSLLITGEPGSGKSAVLNTAAKYLQEQKLDVVTFAVDRLLVNSSDELQRQLGVSHPIREVLRNWPGVEPAFVFIDALDATRGGIGDAVFRNIIADVLEIGGRWRVVASIRTFDLRLGEQFRQLFRGPPPDGQFVDESFRDVRHIEIPTWTQTELDQLLRLAPQIATAIDKGGQPLYDLALVPFNTRLLADLISGGLPPQDFGEIGSQVELLQLYWRHRVARHGTAAEMCLQRAVSEMIKGRALRANKLNAAENDPSAVDTLLRENVLVPLPGERNIAFRHHILFDYAASRVYLDPDDISKTAALLSSESDLGLMLAPALAFALQGLWIASGNHRTSFWSAVITIAGAADSDPIAQSVAARTACEFPKTPDDMNGLSAALQRPGDQRVQAVSALGHIVGALAIRLEDKATVISDPWCYLAVEANNIVSDVAWPLRTLLYLLIEREQSAQCCIQLGTAARGLLRFALDHPTIASHLTIAAIGFVADTYVSDIPASRALFQEILEPRRIQDHGHEDLPWLARKIKAVWEADPDFAVEIYKATFGTEITDKTKTSIGQSQILPLISTRQQDFGMANFALKEAFPQFLSAYPSHAIRALVRAIYSHVSLKRAIETTGAVWTVTVDGQEATLAEDNSRFWAWNPNEEHGDNTAGLLTALVRRLRELPEAEARHLIKVIIQQNRLAVVWSRLFMVASERPVELGGFLWSYAIQRPFLISLDTRKDAIDLIATRYPFERLSDREAFETATLLFDLPKADDPRAYRAPFFKRLFQTIGTDHLATPEARSYVSAEPIRTAQISTNARPFSLQVSSSSPEQWWWLKREGVDVDANANARVLADAENIRLTFGLAGAPAVPPISDIPAAIEALRALSDTANAAVEAGAAGLVTDYAAGVAAAGVKHLAAFEPSQLRQEPGILRDIVALTLALTHHPSPEADPDQEARLEDNPAWGFPAARIDAAEAAILLCRVDSQTVTLLQPRLEALLRDPHAAVRFVVAQHLTALWETDRELMWRLARNVAESEPNRGVLRFFANFCLTRLLHADPEQVEALVIVLLSRVGNPSEKPTAEFLEEIGALIALLWVSYARPEAQRKLKEWLAAIPDHQPEVSHAIGAIRGALVLAYGMDNPIEKAIRQRSQEFAAWTVEASAAGLESYFAAAAGGSSASDEAELASSCAKTLSQICNQLYFASGASSPGGQGNDDQVLGAVDKRKAFLDDVGPMLRRIGDVGTPATIHHLIELLDFLAPADPARVFDLVAHALLGAGKRQGYQFESLGADRFVQIIGRFLADNRDVFVDGARRSDLIACLDVFSEVGWPAARRLLYRLPELLR